MARLPVIAAAVLAIAASAPVICTTTSPASAQGWRDRDGDTDRDLRDLLRDRIRTRQDLRDLIVDLIQDRQDMRGRLRERIGERIAERRGGGEEGDCRNRDEDEDGGGWRGRLRERIGERIAERRRGGEEGDCYFLTRSLRAQDGDLLVIVRRRVCRD
ncbi:hypothetical protein SAMN05443247_05804 [Bradyrhizobium erythrophlei]|jgi:hypothetical protein|nr:hypothetical protein SAMN05443247_05804 [Bradyrhizobium erythrophlei]